MWIPEEIMRSLVIAGKALALVRSDDAEELVESGRVAICPSLGRHSMELNFVYRKSQAESPPIAALIEVVSDLWNV